jgi:hypothetical protein
MAHSCPTCGRATCPKCGRRDAWDGTCCNRCQTSSAGLATPALSLRSRQAMDLPKHSNFAPGALWGGLLASAFLVVLLIGLGWYRGWFGPGSRTPDQPKLQVVEESEKTKADLKKGEAKANAAIGTRVVAYVNNQPVSREELGEYLIARFGVERLEFMVNRKIVETECRKHNISVTDDEVNAHHRSELNTLGGAVPLTEEDFVKNILKRFGKTLYEWKEDVIRPKIMMEKLVQNSVKITDKDVREGFEARYGPKVECRMIVLEKGDRFRHEVWNEVRQSREAFIAKAQKQFIPTLASAEGRVPPIHKHFGDKGLEDAAFRLMIGEVSSPIEMKDGSWVILLCESHLPENKTVRFEDEYQKMSREMTELRVKQRIPEVFAELRKAANPQLLLKNEGSVVGQLPPNTPLPAPVGPLDVNPDGTFKMNLPLPPLPPLPPPPGKQ